MSFESKKKTKSDCERCKKAFCDRCNNGVGTLRDSCKRCAEIDCNISNNPCNPDYGYKMITPTLAIGNMNCSSTPFDVIVDLNFPQNGAKEDMIDIVTYGDGKMFFLVGMKVKDRIINRENMVNKDALRYNAEVMYDVLVSLIPMLLSIYHLHPSYRFLFKCFGGLHRSLTIATAFYCKSTGLSLEVAYDKIDSIMKPLVAIKDKKIGTYYQVLEKFLKK